MYGALPEFTRRWTRRYLIEEIDKFLQVNYCIEDWEKEEEQKDKWGNESDFYIKEIYKRKAGDSSMDEEIEVFQTMKFIRLEFHLQSVFKKYSYDDFEFSFKRTNSPEYGEGYWWGDLFQLNRIESYGGLNGQKRVENAVVTLIYQLQHYLEDADIERDREIYVHCEKLIEEAYEQGIHNAVSLGGAKFGDEFLQALKERGCGFRTFDIVNMLFYGRSQGGTYTREKMAELLIDSNRKIPFDFDAIETDDWGL